MTLYQRSPGLQLGIMGLIAANVTFQIINSIAQHFHIGVIIFLAICLAVLLVSVVVLILDITQKPRILSGEVIFLEEYRIHIRQENDKLKKIRVRKAEYTQFYVGQQVNLHWTRSWSMLLSITAKEAQ